MPTEADSVSLANAVRDVDSGYNGRVSKAFPLTARRRPELRTASGDRTRIRMIRGAFVPRCLRRLKSFPFPGVIHRLGAGRLGRFAGAGMA